MARQSKDGTKLIVELELSGEAPRGLVRGALIVELNHPVMKERRFKLSGFVR